MIHQLEHLILDSSQSPVLLSYCSELITDVAGHHQAVWEQ